MPKRVYMLVTSPDARGGIARATLRLASELAETHQVEMIALHRRSRTRYPLDPRVKVRSIIDEATPEERKLQDLPTKTPGGERTGSYSALVDAVLPRVLGALEPGILISTRAVFHLEIAKHAPAHCITIAQDHTNLQMREAKSNAQQDDPDVATDLALVAEAIGRLDRYVVLTEADAASYRTMFPEASDRLSVIRNPAPWPVLKPGGSGRTRQDVVVAVGRLGGRKGFDLLIEWYGSIAKKRPNWQLHIYGEGPQRKRLNRMINQGGLQDTVFLKGQSDEIERVLEEASIMALTSRYEGLPMVLIEAMTKGVPAVSVDCPNGPAEIVVDGVTGRLVPNNDGPAFTSALLELMDDPATRAQMSEQALKYAEQYAVARVTQNWLDLFDSLWAKRAQTA